MAENTGALTGIRVIDAGTTAAGPWASMLLGDLGAEVIRLFNPQHDATAHLPPFKRGTGMMYMALNLSKRNIVVDLRRAEDREIALRLVDEADVFIENFRPGAMDRLGFGYEALRERNPRLIYCSAPAFGSEGPWAGRASADPYMQAYSGFASVQGQPGSTGEFLRSYGHLDATTGVLLAQGALLALLHREQTGMGQRVETSLLAGALALQLTRLVEYFATGEDVRPMGSAHAWVVPSQAFRAADGKYLFVSAADQGQWERLAQAMSLPALLGDARFGSPEARIAHREELAQLLEERFGEWPSYLWLARLRRRLVPCAPYNRYDTILMDSYPYESGLLAKRETPWGAMTVPGLPWLLSETPAHIGTVSELDGDRDGIVADGWQTQAPAGGSPPPTPVPPPSHGVARGGPLAGVTVVDMADDIAGAYCSRLLALAGASVVKVEPPQGDAMRQRRPFLERGGARESSLFQELHRGKSSVVLDLDEPGGLRKLRRLLRGADILLVNAAASLPRALDYGRVRRGNPHLIYLSISPVEPGCPWGEEATEAEVQAMSGALSYMGQEDQPPVRVGADLAATSAGLMAMLAAVAALYHRRRGGTGQRIQTSHLRAMFSMSWWWTLFSDPDDWVGWGVTGPHDYAERGYQTADRPVLFSFIIGSLEKGRQAWCALMSDLGYEELAQDPWWTEHGVRTVGMGRDAQQHKVLYEARMASITSEAFLQMLKECGGYGEAVQTYSDVVPEAQAMGLITRIRHDALGDILTLGPPWRFSRMTLPEPGPAPVLDADTRRLLSEPGEAPGMLPAGRAIRRAPPR